MTLENYRPVPSYKNETHFTNFEPAIHLFQALDLPTDYFQQDWQWSDLEHKDLIAQINEIGNLFLSKVLQSPPPRTLLNQAYDYLAEEDAPEPAELIFVFGAKTPARVEKAIELYQQGLAPKLMFSGGNAVYHQQEYSEAETYRDIAIQAGVKESDIILETKSITLPDNVRTSLNYLDQNNFPLKKLILVNSPYCQRRGWCVFKKYTLHDIAITRINCTTGDTYSREQWFKHPEGIKVVFNELVKIKLSHILNTA